MSNARGGELLVQRRDVLLIAGFDRAEDVDRRHVGTGERPIVRDLLHARASLGNDARQPRQAAGAVADHGGEADEPAVGHECRFDQPAEDRQINIAARQDEDNALAC